MQKIFFTALIFSVLLITLPLLAVKKAPDKTAIKTAAAVSAKTENNKNTESFRLLLSDGKTVETLSCEDYIFGVVAAEMPALYETEALKAQAVAAYTFAIRRKAQNRDKEYDISADSKVDQSYISLEAAKTKWGENAEEYEEKIRSAVKSVAGKAVYYKGDVALTVYHAVSSGKTENAKDIWGGNYKYLCTADSVCDKLSPNYLSYHSFSFDELKNLLGDNFDFSKGNIKYDKTDVGTVKTLTVAKEEISGEEVREKLSLRSANFTLKTEENTVVFEVKGYGHGVGMSQYGADYMAKQGADYIEILKHYYKGVTVK